jgi:BlaI family penicillinase repressor
LVKRRSAGGGNASIPDAELELLALLVRLGESEATVLRSVLAAQRPLAHPSVVTLLRRLEKRGLVRRRPASRGRAFLYSAQGTGLASHLRRLAARVFGNDRVHLVSTLFEGEPPSAGELADLARLIEQLHERKGGRKPE